jgi:hypothetical protein
MPMMTSRGAVNRNELPSTLQASPAKAERTFAQAHDSAFEKIGDDWEPEATKGPSDEQSAKVGARSSRRYPTAEGVDAIASKSHLRDGARRLDIPGRMSKSELVPAIEKANRRASIAAPREP